MLDGPNPQPRTSSSHCLTLPLPAVVAARCASSSHCHSTAPACCGGGQVHFIVASCENMVAGHGLRPGDILTSAAGLTVEVNNTDAEGRLTLADALWYAQVCGGGAWRWSWMWGSRQQINTFSAKSVFGAGTMTWMRGSSQPASRDALPCPNPSCLAPVHCCHTLMCPASRHTHTHAAAPRPHEAHAAASRLPTIACARPHFRPIKKTPNPKPPTQNPQPPTLNPKPQSLNPKP